MEILNKKQNDLDLRISELQNDIIQTDTIINDLELDSYKECKKFCFCFCLVCVHAKNITQK